MSLAVPAEPLSPVPGFRPPGARLIEVVVLSSTQGYQDSRIHALVSRLRSERPDVKVEVLDPAASASVLATHKLKFGPAILINGRIEFVGIPRFRMLVERLATVGLPEPAPRSVMRKAPGE
ncbi:MAG: hypothetical protein ACT4OI_04565 [Methanobacteriota archaeon]